MSLKLDTTCSSKLLFEHHFCLNNRPFVFSIIDNNFDPGCHNNKIWHEAKFLCQVLTACKVSNKSNRRLLRYCTFIFSLSSSTASVTSYLIENEAENLKMATSILPKFLTLKWNISRTIWLIEVGDGSFFFFHFSRSFIWAQLCFRPKVPFKDLCAGPKVETSQNWKRVRSFHFWAWPKTGNAAAWPKSGNQSVIHDYTDVLYSC